jgi:hypothetical protein
MELLAGFDERRDQFGDADLQRFWLLVTGVRRARCDRMVHEPLQGSTAVHADQHCYVPRPLVEYFTQPKLEHSACGPCSWTSRGQVHDGEGGEELVEKPILEAGDYLPPARSKVHAVPRPANKVGF